MILAGDIGGTKTHLGLFEVAGDSEGDRKAPRLLRFASLPSASFADLPALVRAAFPDLAPTKIAGAAFGVPAPVVGGRAATPNLAWSTLVESEIAADLGVSSILLVNDLAAAAAAVDLLPEDRFAVVQAGDPAAAGSRVLVSAGTGLGVAILARSDSGATVVVPSEGGHSDFAPRDAEGFALLEFLSARYAVVSGGHVGLERVVSGRGIADLYDFLVARGSAPAAGAQEAKERGGDVSAAVAKAASESSTAARALDLFCDAYGAATGNLALIAGATGGVFLGGGVAPRLRERFTSGAFLRAFRAKGRFAGYLDRIPVRLILDDRAGLLGAAVLAGKVSRTSTGDSPYGVKLST